MMDHIKTNAFIILMIALISVQSDCSKKTNSQAPTPPIGTNAISFWVTKADQSVLLQKQSGLLALGS